MEKLQLLEAPVEKEEWSTRADTEFGTSSAAAADERRWSAELPALEPISENKLNCNART